MSDEEERVRRAAPPDAASPGSGTPAPEVPLSEVAARVAASSGLRRRQDGNIDVLASVGGVRGLLESLLPGLVFLGAFIGTQALEVSLVASVAVGVVLFAARAVRRQQIASALSGLVGILVCALFARVGGQARDYYVPGFYIDVAYIVALAVSVAVRWPLAGVIFGFLHGENLSWRGKRARERGYAAATWLIVAVFVLRLVVQVPLYLADRVTLLGTARLVMGVPLYLGALALAWAITRPPSAALEAGAEDAADPDGGRPDGGR